MSPRTKSIIFPAELEDAIQRRADAEERSFTRQVIWMLTDYLRSQADICQRVERIETVVTEIAEKCLRS